MAQSGKRSKYYVMYLGWKESKGVWGREFAEPIVKELIHRRANETLPKLTLELSKKELKIQQSVDKRKGKVEKVKYPTVQSKDVTYAAQATSPDEDVVACIFLGYNPQTQCAVHVHAYKCDSDRTAEDLVYHLNKIIELKEHKDRVAKIEQELVSKGQVMPRSSYNALPYGADDQSTQAPSSDDGITIGDQYDYQDSGGPDYGGYRSYGNVRKGLPRTNYIAEEEDRAKDVYTGRENVPSPGYVSPRLQRNMSQRDPDPKDFYSQDNIPNAGYASPRLLRSKSKRDSDSKDFYSQDNIPNTGYVSPRLLRSKSKRDSDPNEEVDFRVKTEMFESLTDELKRKMNIKEKGPMLLPPKDYDTVQRMHGNLSNIKERKSLNVNLVGTTGGEEGKLYETSTRDSGLESPGKGGDSGGRNSYDYRNSNSSHSPTYRSQEGGSSNRSSSSSGRQKEHQGEPLYGNQNSLLRRAPSREDDNELIAVTPRWKAQKQSYKQPVSPTGAGAISPRLERAMSPGPELRQSNYFPQDRTLPGYLQSTQSLMAQPTYSADPNYGSYTLPGHSGGSKKYTPSTLGLAPHRNGRASGDEGYRSLERSNSNAKHNGGYGGPDYVRSHNDLGRNQSRYGGNGHY